MADNDRTRGYRDNGMLRRPGTRSPAAPVAGDPLAELARLIGQQNEADPQNDPRPARPSYGAAQQAEPSWAAPDRYASQDSYRQDPGDAGWRDDAPRGGYAGGHDPYADGSGGYTDRDYGHAPYPSAYGDSRYTGPAYQDGHYSDPAYGDARYAADPRYVADPRYDNSQYGDPRYQDPRYADPRYHQDPRYDDGRYADQGYAPQSYGHPPVAPGPDRYAPTGAAPDYSAYGHADADRGYGHPYDPSGAPPIPQAIAPEAGRRIPLPRRGNLVTVLAVLALAVVGTAAAFGYRAISGGGGTAVPPPVIKADPQPSKIVPATDASKPIQDRIGAKIEKVIPRQEEPVQQAAPGQPKTIAPFLAGQNPQAFPPASANVPSGGTAEPKRIRTVPIKPQGAEAPAPRSSRTPPAQAEETASADSHSPLSLAPTGSVPPQRQTARQAHAALNPNAAPSTSPFPTPIAPSTSNSVPSGAYVVQVTSQRSESDAQASYRSLQQQFPSVLGNRQPVIRRADLGERGTYYRAQIPFGSQSEANEFCSSLKSAGGQCVVQRN